MRKYGLIGYPLGHSFSKKYFTDKFVNEHINDCSYENFPLKDLSHLQKLIEVEPELCGLNVTIPYKSQIINSLDYIDPEAKDIGAVNVLKLKRTNSSQKLHGYNSDITGIRDSLSPYIKGVISYAIVMGTGGSSKAVLHVLKKFGIKVINVSRTRKPGVFCYSDISSEILSQANLLINTTPLGMFPDTESKPDIDYSLLKPGQILFDLVYNPELTTFLRMGKDNGTTIISGLKMLHSQAEKSWEIWNNDKL